MRVNVYNEELTEEVEVVTVEPRPGRVFIGIRFLLKSHPDLHHSAEDDDRSAVTIWAGNERKARELLTAALNALESRNH